MDDGRQVMSKAHIAFDKVSSIVCGGHEIDQLETRIACGSHIC
jgi:hypothetical protein